MHAPPLLALFLATLYYCHRFYGVFFPFDGDSLNFIYFRLHPHLIAADHNPYQFESMVGYPAGDGNPLLLILRPLISVLSLSPVTQAIVLNMSMALVTQFLLSVTYYFLFFHLTKTRVGAWIGAIVVSYTGFHLVGVREFNTMYAQSLLCTAGMLWVTIQIQKGTLSFSKLGFISTCVGFSLLGGSNSPLFCFIPWLVLYIFFCSKEKRWEKTGFLILGILIGVVSGAFAWLPKILSMDALARGHIDFWGGKSPLTLKDLWVGFFFPEVARSVHWSETWWNIQETACFLGAPVTWLTAVGLWKKRKEPESFFFLLLLLISLAIVLSSHLPRWLTAPLGDFYSLFSIRNPNRFWAMALPSIGYFAAHGTHQLLNSSRRTSYVPVVFSMAVTAIWVIFPNWKDMVPDAHPAIILTSLASLLAIFFLLTQRGKLAACMIFLMYAWAPIQFTGAIWNYFYFFKQGGAVPASQLSLNNVLGFNFTYQFLFNEGKRIFSTTPDYLLSPRTKEGRIFDEPTHDVHENYFAPLTGHRFAFSGTIDPARFKNINVLARIRTNAILGMSNVCTILERDPKNLTSRIVVTNPCLPFSFWVPSALNFDSDPAVIDWLKSAGLEDFSHQVALLNERALVSQTRIPKPASPSLTYSEQPGRIIVEGKAHEPGFVFLSTPFRKDWEATMDGKAIRLLRANLAYMAVKVEKPGPFRLEIQLNYALRNWAVFLTVAGFIVSVLLLVLDYRGLAKVRRKLPQDVAFG